MRRRVTKAHFIGIGGSGMNGIAEVLRDLGYEVSGSDLKASPVTERLQSLGVEVRIGHRAENVGAADVVVVSSAVTEDNPEVRAARERRIPVIPRAEMLAELMRMKEGIAVAGAHGKTNTTSMVAAVMQAGGFDPTVVIGGRLKSIGGHARLGKGEVLVAEADESDGSFLLLSPVTTVVTNLDREHMNHYGNMERLREAFVSFINKVPFHGVNVCCLDDAELREHVLPKARRPVLTYGVREGAELRAADIRLHEFSCSYEVLWKGRPLGGISMNIPGRHSVLNSLAAVGVGLDWKIPFETIREALAGCSSADRRFQKKGESRGALVIDDYGHHPTEIRATLAAARQGWPGRRVIAVFQPHRYSRSHDLQEEFATAFADAAIVIVTPVYAAGEAPIEGVSGEALARAMRKAGQPDVRVAGNLEDAAAIASEFFGKGDILLTLGAGDVWKAGEMILQKHGSKGAAA
jgi:UDP-N-acetylmuramate--alanine ligase